MNVAASIVRVLLGLLFTAAGTSSFVFTTPPPLPGLAGTFNDAFVLSHWSMFVGAAQLVIGVLLLTNRFLTIALIMLAAFLYNSLAFHLTMMRGGLPLALAVFALWAFLCWRNRERFEPLLK
jgi:putative oxidoreductase